MILCKDCKFYDQALRQCNCPKMFYGYRIQQGSDASDALAVENDEGWGMQPGPEFGCIHGKSKTGEVSDPIQVLRDLNEVYNLGDIVYKIRECEGKGWDGPLVSKWSDACRRAEALFRNIPSVVPPETMEQLAKQVYNLATNLWYRLVNRAGGHCGVAGPSSDAPWDLSIGYLKGAIASLKEILQQTGD